MPKYKYVLTFNDGDTFDSELDDEGNYFDGTFDTEEEAKQGAANFISEYRAGGEVLQMSNPFDEDYDMGEDIETEIVEI